MDSDAHADVQVGSHELAQEMLDLAGFPEELVVNSSREILKEYINKGYLL